jgi:PTS system nitrogen regulatory IIA component
MSHETFSIEELAQRLGRNLRDIEKLANRGRIPGRKVDGKWQFHSTEIAHWLEDQMRDYSDEQLAVVEEAHRSTEVDVDQPVTSLLKPETIQVPLEARTKRSVLEALVEVAGRTWQIWEPATVLRAVLEREDLFPTGYENGVAIPHPRNPLPDALGESIVAFGRTMTGIPFGGPSPLSDVFFLVLCRDSRTHLQVLARLGRMLQLPGFLGDLRGAQTAADVYDRLRAADEQLGKR